jgi:stearoyl-CoA desaturase (delta-9 desaturase)
MMRVGILAGGVEMPAEHIVPPSQRLIISASVPKTTDLTASSPT